MIEVEHLTKDYGTVVAVRDLSFQVAAGQVVGFIGPNGAGKSTTLRILAGFLGATAGRVRVAGHDVASEPLEARRLLGYLPETSPLYPELRVREYLAFRAQLKRVPRPDRRRAVERALALTVVEDVADTLIVHLSRGYRQRVGLADALLSNPPLLILDEPTAGLDPNQIREMRRLIRELGREHTILLSTHILSEIEFTCDRAIVIDRGRVVAEGTLEELGALRRTCRVLLVLSDPEQLAESTLAQVPGVAATTARKQADLTELELSLAAATPDQGRVLEASVAALVRRGIGVRELRPARARLEDVFAELTRVDPTPEEAAP